MTDNISRNDLMIVPEGDHILVTDAGVELLGEHGKSVIVECDCGARLELRVCADVPFADHEADAVVDEHLRERGWISERDVCAACAQGAPL